MDKDVEVRLWVLVHTTTKDHLHLDIVLLSSVHHSFPVVHLLQIDVNHREDDMIGLCVK